MVGLTQRRRLVAGVMLIALVASTGLGVANNLMADGTPSIVAYDAFEVVSPVGPTQGEIETPIRAARINGDGTLELVIEGSLCSAFTWAQVAETRPEVQVRAFVWSDDALCPAALVPWLVEVRLEEPLGSRTLLVGTSPRALDVVDCRAIADADICRVGESAIL